MSSHGLWQNLFRRNPEHRLASVLARVPIFADLNPAEVRLVTRLVHERTYQPDELVFIEGQPGTGMYVVASGGVHVVLNYGRPRELRLAQLSEGDFFGELALLDEGPRSATAVAVGATRLIGFFRPDLLDLVDKMPRLGNKITLALAEVLGERLRATNEELRQLHERERGAGAPVPSPAAPAPRA